MKTLRTPDERFEDLPGYAFAPHYCEVDDGDGGRLRIHHVDEGPRDGEVVLLLHGQPTWSFLYRKMIPILAEAGHRVIAPDLVGFGRSDKPASQDDYSYARHVAWFSRWLETLDLERVTLFCQDWGGLVGLRLVAAYPERFARVIAANTALPDGIIPPEATAALRKVYEGLPVVEASELGRYFAAKDGPPGMLYWQKYCAETPELRASDVVAVLGRERDGSAVAAAYDAPFPSQEYVAGARKFPRLVPLFADDPEVPAVREAWKVLERFDKPFLTAFSDSDPVTAGYQLVFQKRVPGCRGVAHVTIANAGHFLQEDQGEACAAAVLQFVSDHPL
jgi:haloalkane dehalogenase